MYYLDRERWLELGVVIFSQYFDTARWMAEQLAKRCPDEANGCLRARAVAGSNSAVNACRASARRSRRWRPRVPDPNLGGLY